VGARALGSADDAARMLHFGGRVELSATPN
jgi:hypothetical protein